MKRTIVILLALFAFSAHAQQTPESEISKNVLKGHTMLRTYDAADTEPYGRGTFQVLDGGWEVFRVKDGKMLADILSGFPAEGWEECGDINSVVYTGEESYMVYRTVFPTMQKWDFRQVFLSVGKPVGKCTVYLNGEWVGESSESGSVAEFDITSYLGGKNNELMIVCGGYDSVSMLETDPEPADFGIKGDIAVYGRDKVYISDVICKTTYKPETGKAFMENIVSVKSELLNEKGFRLSFKLLSPDGTEVFYGFKDSALENKGEGEYLFSFTLDEPKLWSAETPDLYTLEIELKSDGNEGEVVTLQTGLRMLEYSGGRLSVNGMEPDFKAAAFMPVLSDGYADAERRVQELKQNGVNLLVARGPMTEEYLKACDKIGMYVADIFNIDNSKSGKSLSVGGSLSNDPAWLPNHKARIERQSLNHRFHPSVVAWSLTGGGANGYNIQESYLFVKDLDKERPVVNTSAAGGWNTDSFPALNVEE